MEAHINFFPKTKQLKKFKLFETKDVIHLQFNIVSNTYSLPQTKYRASSLP